jgi:hypothetical protein
MARSLREEFKKFKELGRARLPVQAAKVRGG